MEELTMGARISAHRKNKGLTQEALANTLGVSNQAVSKWESGASDPSTANLIAIAKLYEVSAEEILRKVRKEE